ncbi:uncharacterized protein L203_102334 [Cryptococcus depauperatus CBS 7841]|uniref:Uncharacterized protein n=1 Tax=Cryptococcus depauperatus CBS 7841 TaxID=1295531 RepID=A0A1E3IAD0_9TREE|nr:hypothetical protein L203_04791 [Cryptococcus depauperatus CBS 7841]
MHAASYIALAAAAAGSAMAISINTPAALVQCQPAQLTWTEGTGPFIIAAIPGGQVSAAAIETISDNVSASPYTWNVNLASGSNITLKITDSTGTIGYSSPVVIQAGSSSSCLNSSASTSGLSSAPGGVTTTVTSSMSSGSSAGSSASSATSAANSKGSSAAAGASSAVSSPATSSTGKPSGAMVNAIVGLPALVAGVITGLAAFL